MEKFWKKEADERWKDICRLSYVVGYLKGELRSKGYTTEQLDKLEKDAIEHHNRLNGK